MTRCVAAEPPPPPAASHSPEPVSSVPTKRQTTDLVCPHRQALGSVGDWFKSLGGKTAAAGHDGEEPEAHLEYCSLESVFHDRLEVQSLRSDDGESPPPKAGCKVKWGEERSWKTRQPSTVCCAEGQRRASLACGPKRWCK